MYEEVRALTLDGAWLKISETLLNFTGNHQAGCVQSEDVLLSVFAAHEVEIEQGEPGLLCVSLLPSSRHRSSDHRRRNAEEGGQIQTGWALPRPVLLPQKERRGEVSFIHARCRRARRSQPTVSLTELHCSR